MTTPADPRMAQSEDQHDPGAAPGAPGRPAPTSQRMTAAEREEALIRQRALGKRLRPMWDDVLGEPLPDDFLSLLDDMKTDGDDKGGGQ